MTATTIFDVIGGEWAPWFRRFKHLPGQQRETWAPWFSFLRVLFGLALNDGDVELFRRCTGRNDKPSGGFSEAWLICGRRSGKSRMLAMIAIFIAVFVDWAPYLSPGERGTIMIIAADRKQSRTIFRYAMAFLKAIDIETVAIERETADTIELSNSINIEIQTASYRSVRGYTVVGALLDEIAFWSDEGANPDKEILAALKPAMATVPGAMLLCASSPFARRGVLFDAHRKHHGRDGDPILLWQAPTLTMNPTVSEEFIKAETEKDPASAAAEYGAQFRDDIASFVDRSLIESLVIPNRLELPPASSITYHAFVDPAGGSGGDSMVVAVAHKDKSGQLVLDAIREAKPQFSPDDVVKEFSALLISYGVNKVTGDAWGGLFVRQPFAPIEYQLAEQSKSNIYRDVLALLNSRRVELLDHPGLIAQLCGLERRTARGGKDSIDHPPGQHDDVVNACMGALLLANTADHKTIHWFAVSHDGKIYGNGGENPEHIALDSPDIDGVFLMDFQRRAVLGRDWQERLR